MGIISKNSAVRLVNWTGLVIMIKDFFLKLVFPFLVVLVSMILGAIPSIHNKEKSFETIVMLVMLAVPVVLGYCAAGVAKIMLHRIEVRIGQDVFSQEYTEANGDTLVVTRLQKNSKWREAVYSCEKEVDYGIPIPSIDRTDRKKYTRKGWHDHVNNWVEKYTNEYLYDVEHHGDAFTTPLTLRCYGRPEVEASFLVMAPNQPLPAHVIHNVNEDGTRDE
ncbi:hypothetical protein [Lactiplantibacillus plantarum]|uniref:hypothetical protein n=1 Tax=Lactiplantibacillus plantarum TaxID=1590 RepID=UPI0020010D90|nr:hypothetical protein [Lactiplantibacillus plantarum]